MRTTKIITTENVYQLVERLKVEAVKNELTGLAGQLDDALSLGSSGLEILGAIRQTFIKNRATIERLLGPTGKDKTDQLITFVDKAFGRSAH
jgi:hypothetical protein